jgi:hypothetical protein
MITNANGTAIIYIGFINSLLKGLLEAFGYWKREWGTGNPS